MNKHELKSLLENIYSALTETTEWHPPLLPHLAPFDHYPIPYAPKRRWARITPIWLSPLQPPPPRIKPTSSRQLTRYTPTSTVGPDDPSPGEYELYDHWLKDQALLENIYSALTEAAPPQPEMIPWIPPYGFPVVPIQIPTTPVAPPKPPVDDPDEEELDPNDPSTYELQIKQLMEDWEFALGLLDMAPIDAQSKAARDLVNRQFQAEIERLQRLIRERDQGGPVG